MWAMFPILVYGYDLAADQNRVAAAEWRRLAGLLLPDEVEPLCETRALLERRHVAFLVKAAAVAALTAARG